MNIKEYRSAILNILQSSLSEDKYDYNLLIRHIRSCTTEIKGSDRFSEESERVETSLILYSDKGEVCGWLDEKETGKFRILAEDLKRKLKSNKTHHEDSLPQRGFILKRDLQIDDEHVHNLDQNTRKELITRYFEEILKTNQAISSISRITLKDSVRYTSIDHSSGFSHEYFSTVMELNGSLYFRRNSNLQREEFCFSSRSVDKLSAEIDRFQLDFKEYPLVTQPYRDMAIILRPPASSTILEYIHRCLNPDTDEFKYSPIHAKMGRKIAHSQIDIFDDGLFPEGLFTVPYDDEGVNSQSTPVITEGRLRNILTDHRRAKELHGSFTGNGFRAFGECTRIQPTNFLLVPIASKTEDMSTYFPDALEICKMEVNEFDPLGGNFIVTAKGYVLRDAVRERRFSGIIFEGNFYDIIQHVDSVGNDVRWNGHFGSPTICIGKTLTWVS